MRAEKDTEDKVQELLIKSWWFFNCPRDEEEEEWLRGVPEMQKNRRPFIIIIIIPIASANSSSATYGHDNIIDTFFRLLLPRRWINYSLTHELINCREKGEGEAIRVFQLITISLFGGWQPKCSSRVSCICRKLPVVSVHV